MDRQFKGLLLFTFFGIGLYLIYKGMGKVNDIIDGKKEFSNPITFPEEENAQTDFEIKPKKKS
jgi:hypothetical protein